MGNLFARFVIVKDGGEVTLEKIEPTRPRCWLDWENTEDYEDEDERQGIDCWLEDDDE